MVSNICIVEFVIMKGLFLSTFQNPTVCPKAVERSQKLAELLIAQGCDPSALDEDKQSPLMYAVEQVRRVSCRGSHGTIVVHWTAGRQVKRSNRHLRHDSY